MASGIAPAAPPSDSPGFAPDGEPLCRPPPPAELCEAARRRLPEVEAELRRRLSGPDRSVEAVELEALVQGARPAPPEAPDPLLEQGLLALSAAHVLGLPAAVPLAEALALRGLRVQRSTLLPDHAPRALEHLDLDVGRREGPDIEVARAPRGSPAARALIALAAAGLSRPLVIIDREARSAAVTDREARSAAVTDREAPAPFLHAGLHAALRETLARATAPHAAEDASAPMAPLLAALRGRNPWHLYRLAEVPWHNGWSTRVRQPELTAAGLKLAEQTLLRPPGPDETFALACHALGAAERIQALLPQAPDHPFCAADEANLDARQSRLIDALRRLVRRPLLPGPPEGGEAVLFLMMAATAGHFVMETGHPDELGRLLCPAPGAARGGYARLRLLRFPSEPPQALSVSIPRPGPGFHVDGGDLRVHIEVFPGTSLLTP